MWGSTESALLPQLLAGPEEYEYCLFDPETSGTRFQEAGANVLDDDGQAVPLWEMVLTLTPESAPYAFWAHARGLLSVDSKPVEEASGRTDLRVGDLWLPHPDPAKAKSLWRFAGRTDDLITFSTGVNLYPVPVQTALGSSPAVHGALVFGNERLQPIVLIELAKDIQASETLKQELWDHIIRPHNGITPSYGRIDQTHMLLIPHGGFVRTSKGTAKRMETQQKHAKEIEQVYQRFGDSWKGNRDRYGSVVVERSFSLSASSDAAEP